MKLKNLTMMLCVALLSGCTKQAESEAPQIDYKAQFEESDRKIGEFLDQLDNPNTLKKLKLKFYVMTILRCIKTIHACINKSFTKTVY